MFRFLHELYSKTGTNVSNPTLYIIRKEEGAIPPPLFYLLNRYTLHVSSRWKTVLGIKTNHGNEGTYAFIG